MSPNKSLRPPKEFGSKSKWEKKARELIYNKSLVCGQCRKRGIYLFYRQRQKDFLRLQPRMLNPKMSFLPELQLYGFNGIL